MRLLQNIDLQSLITNGEIKVKMSWSLYILVIKWWVRNNKWKKIWIYHLNRVQRRNLEHLSPRERVKITWIRNLPTNRTLTVSVTNSEYTGNAIKPYIASTTLPSITNGSI